METTHDFYQENTQTTNQAVSLTEYSQIHPYQYLKKLNNIYQKCNKASGKDFSSASMIKLPWKKFKPVTIPKCFEETYNMQRKQTFIIRNNDDNQNSQEAQKQKKFWREHQDLMRKYHQNKIANNNNAKNRYEQRRKQLFSAKSCSGLPNQSSFSYSSKNMHKSKTDGVSKIHKNKQNQQHTTTLKTESDQSFQVGLTLSKGTIPNNFSSPNLLKENMNSSLAKSKVVKERHMKESMSVEEQVLQKLKKISQMPHLNRAKTANLLSKQSKCFREREKLQASFKKPTQRDDLQDSRVKQGEYLQFNNKDDLIERYKNKIKQIDCSISQKNVKKTADVLKQMQQIYSIDIEDY